MAEDQPAVAVATGGDAPSTDDLAAASSAASAGAAEVHAEQAGAAAAVAAQAAAVAAESAAVTEGAAESAAVATSAAEQSSALVAEHRSITERFEAAVARLEDMGRAEPPAPAVPAPTEGAEEAAKPEPDKPPRRPSHWINRPVGAKRKRES